MLLLNGGPRKVLERNPHAPGACRPLAMIWGRAGTHTSPAAEPSLVPGSAQQDQLWQRIGAAPHEGILLVVLPEHSARLKRQAEHE